jgi:uncharacterized metal-binding protein YceD (DUF177 family)
MPSHHRPPGGADGPHGPEFNRSEFSRPEFSRVVRLDSIEKGETRFHWEASAAELAALARRFDIPALRALDATVKLRPLMKGGAEAEIAFAAEAVQRSVISLEAVPIPIAERVTVRYLKPAEIAALDAEAEERGEGLADEDIEPIDGESIDIGETIAQQLSLALDPYPRQEGERLEDYWAPGDDPSPEERHPFDVLRNLKQNT